MDNAPNKTVLVIGGGLAGITAALAAMKNGAQVILVTSGPGTFALSGATVSIRGMNKEQPYLQEALDFFKDITIAAECEYKGAFTGSTFIPDIIGGLQEIALAPFSLWAGRPVNGSKVMIVGIRGLSGFSAGLTAELLTSSVKQIGLQVTYRTATIEIPWVRNGFFTSLEVANHLEDKQRQAQLAELLKPLVKNQDLLLLPAIFGMTMGSGEFNGLARQIGCSVGELITLPPSMVGLRVLHAMQKYLKQSGVEIISGYPVQALQVEDGICTAAFVDTPGRNRVIKVGSIIVATGRINKSSLAIRTPSQKTETFLQDDCLVNESMQLLNEQNIPFAANIYGAGDMLETSDCKNGNALAIWTGYRAGVLAAGGDNIG
ncbi:FAD-binding protein [Sporomusa acidovorans]|nr:FAD-binding protein [Sporomusa acidovorans]